LSVVITDQFSSYITYKSRRRLFYQALIQGSALSAPSHRLFPEEKAKLKGYKLYKQAEQTRRQGFVFTQSACDTPTANWPT